MADILQPKLPAPAAPSTPTAPAVLHPKTMGPGPEPAPATGNLVSKGLNFLSNPAGSLNKAAPWLSPNMLRYGAVATMPESPAVRAAAGLPGGMTEPVQGFLRFAQRGLNNNPGMTAGLLGGLAPGLVRPLLSTPAGLPMLLAAHGMLAGGESAAAADAFTRPLREKLGL